MLIYLFQSIGSRSLNHLGGFMRFIRVVGLPLPLALLLPVLCLAQGSAQTDEIKKLREQIAAQQKVLDRLVATQSAPAVAPTQPAVEVDPKGRPFSPLAFHIGGADFTPGGFMDFSTAWRSATIGSGVATNFPGLPFSNTAAGRLSEFRSSAANSRITLTITENPTKNMAVTGYLEGDFYGNQPANLFVTSNSNTWRMRHFWVNVENGKVGGAGGPDLDAHDA